MTFLIKHFKMSDTDIEKIVSKTKKCINELKNHTEIAKIRLPQKFEEITIK